MLCKTSLQRKILVTTGTNNKKSNNRNKSNWKVRYLTNVAASKCSKSLTHYFNNTIWCDVLRKCTSSGQNDTGPLLEMSILVVSFRSWIEEPFLHFEKLALDCNLFCLHLVHSLFVHISFMEVKLSSFLPCIRRI